ncbi:MAG: hypothetical protein WC069_01265 [Candidatus Shapirobacteria bacterium]
MKGQGIIEAVYSIGILGLILTGVVILILMTVTTKKNDFDRKKASEIGSLVMEELVSKSKNDPVNFWTLINVVGLTKPEFVNYSYDISFTNITADAKYPNCGMGVTDCAEANVNINWQGKSPQTIKINRFFSKNGN